MLLKLYNIVPVHFDSSLAQFYIELDKPAYFAAFQFSLSAKEVARLP